MACGFEELEILAKMNIGSCTRGIRGVFPGPDRRVSRSVPHLGRRYVHSREKKQFDPKHGYNRMNVSGCSAGLLAVIAIALALLPQLAEYEDAPFFLLLLHLPYSNSLFDQFELFWSDHNCSRSGDEEGHSVGEVKDVVTKFGPKHDLSSQIDLDRSCHSSDSPHASAGVVHLCQPHGDQVARPTLGADVG